jgi:hypothetical protein
VALVRRGLDGGRAVDEFDGVGLGVGLFSVVVGFGGVGLPTGDSFVTQPDSMINIAIHTAVSRTRPTLKVNRRELADLGEPHLRVRRARRQVVIVDVKRHGGDDRPR